MPYNVLDPTGAAPAPATAVGNPLTSVGTTFAEMQNELDAMLAGRTDVTAPRLALWINQAYVQVCTDLQIDELQSSIALTTVADQPAYLVPNAVYTTLGAAVVDPDRYGEFGGRPLTKIDLNSYRRAAVETGDVRTYFRFGQMIVLWPTPEESGLTISLDFRLRPNFLVNDLDSPLLGIEWHEAILLNARVKAFGALLEFDKEQIADNRYIKHIRTKLDRGAAEQENMVPTSSVPRSRAMLSRGRNIDSLEP